MEALAAAAHSGHCRALSRNSRPGLWHRESLIPDARSQAKKEDCTQSRRTAQSRKVGGLHGCVPQRLPHRGVQALAQRQARRALLVLPERREGVGRGAFDRRGSLRGARQREQHAACPLLDYVRLTKAHCAQREGGRVLLNDGGSGRGCARGAASAAGVRALALAALGKRGRSRRERRLAEERRRVLRHALQQPGQQLAGRLPHLDLSVSQPLRRRRDHGVEVSARQREKVPARASQWLQGRSMHGLAAGAGAHRCQNGCSASTAAIRTCQWRLLAAERSLCRTPGTACMESMGSRRARRISPMSPCNRPVGHTRRCACLHASV
jgi:hypothetical protein